MNVSIEESKANPIEILLVEDMEQDIDLTKEALADARITNNLRVVTDGELALEYLFKQNQYSEAPTPDLILLDLNLPKKSGFDVMKAIKADDHLKRIPVVVLTTSDSEHDVLKSYDLHANCYITKPVDMKQFMKIITMLEEFWLMIVKLPPKN